MKRRLISMIMAFALILTGLIIPKPAKIHGDAFVSGVACEGGMYGETTSKCYNTGTSFVGGIAGVNYDKMNNCYNAGNVKLDNKGKKVSSITFGNCPKLSSKHWTYSSKHKRLILKKNREK